MSTSEGQHRWVGLKRENTRGKTEVVCTSAEQRWWVCWEKDADDGVARKEETGNAKKEVYECGERVHGLG